MIPNKFQADEPEDWVIKTGKKTSIRVNKGLIISIFRN